MDTPTDATLRLAAAKRQADFRFVRAECELKGKCEKILGIAAYEEPSPTESKAQTFARRERIRRKITAADPAARRQAKSRFNRIESELKNECIHALGADHYHYEPPSPTESREATSVRRRRMRHKFIHAAKTEGKKRFRDQFRRSSFDDANAIDITRLLLEHCGIKEVKRKGCVGKLEWLKCTDPIVVYCEGLEKNDGECCECYKKTSRCTVASSQLQQINISGEDLRSMANKLTGGKEGLQMKRTIHAFRYRHEVWGELHRMSGGSWRTDNYHVDIEDINEIVDGRIRIDVRPEMKQFKVTGAGGKPSYATGSIFEARYNGDVEDNFHNFELSLEPTSQHCKKNNLLSAEIHIDRDLVATLDESVAEKTYSVVERGNDGRLYKVVSHYWERNYWYDQLSLDVRFGPLDEGSVGEEEVGVYVDGDVDPYKLLMLGRGKMSLEFVGVSFVENVLKKGGILHQIAVRDAN